ncbi:DUF397 domain-containing protein [Streptomyces lusitanus]|uniref:DUF397 domain-containing protein n=1 Tax=Streptomyces lusitanus TaxID=68232 RepID=UPI003615F300
MKSSYSESGACVEVKLAAELLVRDSKVPAIGALSFPADAWQKFLTILREDTPSS